MTVPVPIQLHRRRLLLVILLTPSQTDYYRSFTWIKGGTTRIRIWRWYVIGFVLVRLLYKPQLHIQTESLWPSQAFVPCARTRGRAVLAPLRHFQCFSIRLKLAVQEYNRQSKIHNHYRA